MMNKNVFLDKTFAGYSRAGGNLIVFIGKLFLSMEIIRPLLPQGWLSN
jgi:hypothetical protein